MSEFNTMKIDTPQREADEEGKEQKSRKQNLVTMTISLIIALVLWAYVIGEVNPVIEMTIENVPVEFLNLDVLEKNGLTVSGDGRYTVDVVVEGKRSDIKKINRSDVIATVDLAGYENGKNYAEVTVSLPSSAELVEIRPEKILITVEELVTASFPIDVVFSEVMEKGMEFGAIETDPQEIQVSGAKSEVERVAAIQVCVDGTAMDDTRKIRVKGTPQAVDKTGNVLKNVALSANRVYITASMMQLKEVDLVVETVGTAANGLAAFIDTEKRLKIKGPAEVLEEIASVKAKPIDLSMISEETEVELELQLPDGVEAAEEYRHIQANVQFEPLVSKEFTLTTDSIVFENLEAQKKAEAEPGEIHVTVQGSSEEMKKISKAQLTLTANLQGMEAGEVSIPLKASCSGTVHSITVEPKAIFVTVSTE